MAKLETLVDTFDGPSIDTNKWSSARDASIVSGQLKFTLPAGEGDGFLWSTDSYDFTGSYFLCQVIDFSEITDSLTDPVIGLVSAGGFAGFDMDDGGGFTRSIQAWSDNGTIGLRHTLSLNDWIRMRESGGTIYWEYSSDGDSWTQLASESTGASIFGGEIESVRVMFMCFDTGTDGYLIVDNFNNPPSGDPEAPTVTTQAVSNIQTTTATGNGDVTNDGGETITERGVCWKTSTGPTTSDDKATSSGTTGAFTASMTDLTPDTLYYVRAYAINSVGTSYGNEVTFITDEEGEPVIGPFPTFLP